jgi:hypothetical protein
MSETCPTCNGSICTELVATGTCPSTRHHATMTTLTNADLAAIRERAEAASPGPWDFSTHWVWRTELDGRRAKSFAIVHDNPDDARFIAHSRTDIPALLDTIENLRAENARYRETLEYYANQQNWTDQGVCGRLDDDPDCGARAEFALAQRGKRLRGMG